MSQDVLLRVLALCIALASAEMLHGIAQTIYVAPRIGKERALKLSALTGTLLAFLICLAVVPGIGLASLTQHAALGVVLAVFMACFHIAVGRCLMRRKWVKIWSDFDPRTSNYLLFGLVALALVPMVVLWMRGA